VTGEFKQMSEPILPESTPGSTNVEATKQEVVETKPVETPDYLAVLKEKDDKIAKLSQDKDNYRVGMLKYKKLVEENPEDKSADDERIKQLIKEEILDTQIAQEVREKDLIIQKMAKENAELKVAVQNKSQMPNLPGGSSQPENDLKVEELTADQKAYFDNLSKEIGVKIDPKKFLENWKKNNQK
jgi:hypothetical protein